MRPSLLAAAADFLLVLRLRHVIKAATLSVFHHIRAKASQTKTTLKHSKHLFCRENPSVPFLCSPFNMIAPESDKIASTAVSVSISCSLMRPHTAALKGVQIHDMTLTIIIIVKIIITICYKPITHALPENPWCPKENSFNNSVQVTTIMLND